MSIAKTIINHFETNGAKLIESCENPNTHYIDLGDIRLIFKDGEYAGWYNYR